MSGGCLIIDGLPDGRNPRPVSYCPWPKIPPRLKALWPPTDTRSKGRIPDPHLRMDALELMEEIK